VTTLWARDPARGWHRLAPTSFPAEEVLHDLVATAPETWRFGSSSRSYAAIGVSDVVGPGLRGS
jgi:hypothetical protein